MAQFGLKGLMTLCSIMHLIVPFHPTNPLGSMYLLRDVIGSDASNKSNGIITELTARQSYCLIDC